jgi:undecaprenyl-diphosphatase
VPTRRFWQGSRIAVVVVAAVVLLWLYRVLTVWDDRPTVFAFVFAALVALLLLLDWVFDLVGPPVWRLVRSLALSVGRAVAGDPELTALLGRHPRVGGWLRARLTLQRWSGWYLTSTVLLALYFLARFLGVLHAVVTSSSLAVYDPRLAALLRAFRTAPVTRALWVATIFGDPNSMWAVAAVFVLLLLLWGRRGEAVLVGVTMALGSAAGDLFKVATHRPRPPAFFALIREPTSFSFPSGHAIASLLFFSLLAFVLWRTAGRTARHRFAIVALCALGAFIVALSRVYLGVHWPTDVLGGWLLAAAWLSVTLGTFLMWERYGRGQKRWPPVGTPALRLAITLGVVALALIVLVAGAVRDPLLATLVEAPSPKAFTSAELAAFEKALPRYSEKLDGSPQEPVSLVFVGSQQELEQAFERAGWQKADPQSLTALFRVSVSALANRPYPNAPVTPSFIGGAANALAFEKPQGAATARRRHHVRWWSAGVTLDGEPVWVGTASFDSKLEIGGAIPVPTHHIDPDVDKERAYIVDALVAGGAASRVGGYQVVRPETGTNAAGDKFFTDGRAVLLETH